MKYKINACVKSVVGKVRENNEDNYVFLNKHLDVDNEGSELKTTSFANSNQIYGVFDGMGGEENGEVASYLAASTLCKYFNESKKSFDWKEYIELANDKVLSKVKKNENTGTTVACIKFTKDNYSICNLGDSRIYGYKNGTLTQLSEEHTEEATYKKLNIKHEGKGSLTQHLGIHKNDMILEPYINKFNYQDYDKILICSDGLTDLVDELKISSILSEKNIKEEVQTLIDEAMNNGGKDNTTIMLFEIKKQISPLVFIIPFLLIILGVLLLVLNNNKFKIIHDEYNGSIIVGEKYLLEFNGKGKLIYDDKYIDYRDNYIIGKKSGNTDIEIVDDKGNILYKKDIKIYP